MNTLYYFDYFSNNSEESMMQIGYLFTLTNSFNGFSWTLKTAGA